VGKDSNIPDTLNGDSPFLKSIGESINYSGGHHLCSVMLNDDFGGLAIAMNNNFGRSKCLRCCCIVVVSCTMDL
jgi:hypothetical protein